MTTCRQGTTN